VTRKEKLVGAAAEKKAAEKLRPEILSARLPASKNDFQQSPLRLEEKN